MGLLAGAFLCVSPCHGGQGTTLRVCDDVAQPKTLDPLKEFSEKHFTIIQHIFDSLVRIDPEGRIESALATSWRWIDDLTLECKLRQGVTFHNGEPFDAESVRFSIEKYIDPKTGFPGAGFLNSIAVVEVVDPLTVRIKTRHPDGTLLHRLAGFAPIVPPGYIGQHGERHFGTHPVGTGAFEFVRWDAGTRIVLKANKDYWESGRPGFERLVFLFLPTESQVEGLINGEVDIVTELPGTATLRVMKSGAARIVKKESLYTVGSSINTSSGPLVNKKVRQAINHAINKNTLIRYDLLGNGRPLAGLSMAGEIGHDPELRPYPYDPDKARRLLREAGYPSGVGLKVIVKAQGERTMKVISKQLRKVGIRLDIHLTTDATIIRDIQGRSWDFTFGGCPDPLAHSFFIQFIFLSSFSPYSIHRDAAYDALLRKMTATLDPQEQHRVGMELDRYIHEEALGVFTYQRIRTYGVRNGVAFVPSVTGMPNFALSHPLEKKSR